MERVKRLKQYNYPFKGLRPGLYILESTPENKEDYIKRKIDIVEYDGELGVFFNLIGALTRVQDFRKDCTLTLIKE